MSSDAGERAEVEVDECPDCGFDLADDMGGRLVRTPRASEFPCAACLWAHGDPDVREDSDEQ